ncbi:hypothetical protein [Bradyrhizobium elkanii]|jgi:hypothetical protein|uniref:hypothetical protein n=1 Tax=Bradyrhizobium elkanii TaxID=29448 RepID=UPI0027121365|nr:hypothetical protein [Bradyrhizobium elkanii]WLA40814.1 hypothetical protein QNJ95_04510 [Bradyrhizobium elkanii]WLA47980.1 hypothetical protein QIH80_41410 [Bradyrhizobium elkanii]
MSKAQIIAEILQLSSKLDEEISAGSLVLEFPVDGIDEELRSLEKNPLAVDYIVETE